MTAEKKKKDQPEKPEKKAGKPEKPRAKRGKPTRASNKHARDRVSRKKRFLTVFAQTGVIQHAVRQLGISRSAVQKWRREDPQFAEDFEHAIDDSNERMEREVIRRAVRGTLKPVFHHGVRCGHIREYSDGLLMFMLRARKPHVYRDNATVEHAGKVGVNHGGSVEVRTTVQELLNAPGYLDFVRREASGFTGAICKPGDGGEIHVTEARNGYRQGNNGHTNGQNGKHASN